MKLDWWRRLDRPTRILSVIALAIAACIVAGTLFAGIRLIVSPAAPVPPQGAPSGTEQGAPQGASLGEPLGAAVIELGRIRAITGDHDSADVIVSLSFPYDANDLPWSEELFANKHAFREEVQGFFAGQNLRTLKKLGDEGVRQALRERLNARLLLGSIDQLWLHEYMIVE